MQRSFFLAGGGNEAESRLGTITGNLTQLPDVEDGCFNILPGRSGFRSWQLQGCIDIRDSLAVLSCLKAYRIACSKGTIYVSPSEAFKFQLPNIYCI